VFICYTQIFIAARVQAQRIYDVELAAVAASRRVSTTTIPGQLPEGSPFTNFNRIQVAPLEPNSDDVANGGTGGEVQETQTDQGQNTATESHDLATSVNSGVQGDVTVSASSSTERRPKNLWQSAMNGVAAGTTLSDNSETRWQRTLTKVGSYARFCRPTQCVRMAVAMATWMCVCLCIVPKRLSRSSYGLHRIVSK